MGLAHAVVSFLAKPGIASSNINYSCFNAGVVHNLRQRPVATSERETKDKLAFHSWHVPVASLGGSIKITG